MEYSTGEYGREVKRVKKKNYAIPIIVAVVIFALIIALIIYINSVTRNIKFEGETLTVDNLSDYEQQITDYFYIDSDKITIYGDSSAEVEDGKITSLKIELSIQSYSSKEHWRMVNSSGGVTVKYKSSLDSDAETAYTLSDLSTYLIYLDDILQTDYTVKFYVTEYVSAEASAFNYMWDGDNFNLITESVTASCHKIEATASDGTQYAFFVA